MARSAEDIADKIAELTSSLAEAAKMGDRRDIADHFLDRIKTPEDLRDYLRNSTYTCSNGTKIEYKSFLPGVNADEFEFTPDFLAGVKFVCAALKSKNFEY